MQRKRWPEKTSRFEWYQCPLDAFEAQDEAYRESVLPQAVTSRVAVEAAVTGGWYKYAPVVVGIDHFGESAPAGQLFEEFGFTVDNVVSAVRGVI